MTLPHQGPREPLDAYIVALSGPVEVDLLSRSIVAEPVRVRLRPLELRLLTFLASHPNETFSRSDLLSRVWGPDCGAGPRTVDVHVLWLRRKLSQLPDHERWLVTVRGIGYRWQPTNVNGPITVRERVVDGRHRQLDRSGSK